MKFDEYWSGTDKEPIRMELKPEVANHESKVSVQRRTTFMAKLGAKGDGSSLAKEEPTK